MRELERVAHEWGLDKFARTDIGAAIAGELACHTFGEYEQIGTLPWTVYFGHNEIG